MDFFRIITDANFTWDNPEEPDFEDHADALLSTSEEGLEGNPSEFLIGSDSNALVDPSPDTDLLRSPEDDEEGYPSEPEFGDIRNAPTDPSPDEHIQSDAEDSFEGNPSEPSIGHDCDAPTEPSSDDDRSTTSSCTSPASRPPSCSVAASFANLGVASPARTHWTRQPRPRYRRRPAVLVQSADHAAVLWEPSHPDGNPSGSAQRSLIPDNDQGGYPPYSASQRPASTLSHAAETAPVQDYEQTLRGILLSLGTLKRDEALVHVAAAESFLQLEQLSPQALAIEIDSYAADELVDKALATEDAWLKHISSLADSDRPMWANAHRDYDRFCKEHGFYANIDRSKELVAMLRDVVQQTDNKHHELRALPPKQRNPAFTIVGKMPPVKLCKMPGNPGNAECPGGWSDKRVHGNPCTPLSRPTPRVGTACKPSTKTSAQTAEAPPTDDFEQQLERLLALLAKHNLNVSIAVAAAESSVQHKQVRRYFNDAAATRHDIRTTHDRTHTTNPLDTKPPPTSSSTQPPSVSPATADVELSDEHQLANAITSYFQRQSAGVNVVAGFYVRSQDDAGRTFYRILKPLQPSFTLPRLANELYEHLSVDRVIMAETTAHVLPCDPLLIRTLCRMLTVTHRLDGPPASRRAPPVA